MALSQEVLNQIDYAERLGFHKLHMAPPAETREAMKRAPKNPNPTLVGKVINMTIPDFDIPVRIYIPKGAGPFPVVSYFHGGGFVLLSLDTHDDICRELCVMSGSVVMSVDYRLAPENPFPAAHNDSISATRWMIKHAAEYNGISKKMAVAGDSAGGNLATYVAQKLKAEGGALKAQVIICGALDHYSSNHRSWEENKDGYILTAEMMKWFWDNYITDPSRFDEASPLRFDLSDLSGEAPALIITATYDPLRDEGKAYADKLSAAGVQVLYKNYENVHGFFGTGKTGQEALQTVAEFLKKSFAA